MYNIVYYSKNGYTKQYAEMLANEISVKAVALKQAKKELTKNEKVIFMTSINNNRLNHFKDVSKLFDVEIICAVGMSFYRKTLPELIRIVNMIDDKPIFYMQGGFDISKLNFLEKMMIQVSMAAYSGRTDLSLEETKMLSMLQTPANYVSFDNLKRVIAFLNGVPYEETLEEDPVEEEKTEDENLDNDLLTTPTDDVEEEEKNIE